MKLETSLREDLTSLASELSKEFFESSRGGLSPKFDVQYSEETGRLLIATKVRDVGKPKKPMKDFCKGMLSWMERLYPKQQVGFLWHNRALGILQRDKPSKYQDAVSTLFNSLVYIVDVSATYDTGGKTTLFVLACIKQEADEPISYFKYSYDLKK